MLLLTRKQAFPLALLAHPVSAKAHILPLSSTSIVVTSAGLVFITNVASCLLVTRCHVRPVLNPLSAAAHLRPLERHFHGNPHRQCGWGAHAERPGVTGRQPVQGPAGGLGCFVTSSRRAIRNNAAAVVCVGAHCSGVGRNPTAIACCVEDLPCGLVQAQHMRDLS